MPKPSQRTSVKKVKVKVPSGTLKTYLRKKRNKPAVCGVCGKPLSGVPNLNALKMRTIAKTKKRPERPFGGNLCSSCMRNKIKRRLFESFS